MYFYPHISCAKTVTGIISLLFSHQVNSKEDFCGSLPPSCGLTHEKHAYVPVEQQNQIKLASSVCLLHYILSV